MSQLDASRANALAPYTGTRVVVLGASGFVGRWVARRLGELSADLTLVVRDAARAAPVLDRYGIRGRVAAADAIDTEAMVALVRRLRPTIVFNLVGYGVDRAERDETMAYRLNGRLPCALCEAFEPLAGADWAGQRLVHVASALEYGEVSGSLHEDGPCRPTTLYGRSKLVGTLRLSRRARRRRLRAIAGRLFTVYGPGEHAGRLVPALLECARKDGTLELTAGRQRRDFTYVEDVADGLLRLGLSSAEPGTVVNVASGRLTSVRAFAETAAGVLGIPAGRLRFGAIATRPEEMEHAEVDIGRLLTLTGWRPTTSIETGIARTSAFEAAQPGDSTAREDHGRHRDRA